MAWDFEIEPGFQTRLDEADNFLREEVELLDLAYGGLEVTPPDGARRRAMEPAKEELRRQLALVTYGAYLELEVADQ